MVVLPAAFVLYLEGSGHWEADSLSLPTRVKQGGVSETVTGMARGQSGDGQSWQVYFAFVDPDECPWNKPISEQMGD